MSVCEDLEEALTHSALFNVSGGCGIDMSEGTNCCMEGSGMWFKFCPFCGRKILSEFDGMHWQWWEDRRRKND